MTIKIERMADLLDQEAIDEMLEPVDDIGCCHYNAAMVAVNFDDWDMKYVEGYLGGHIGHAINSYEDQGKVHYIDVTQEYYLKKGLKEEFDTDFEVVKEFSADEINETFDKDGETHLVAVDIHKIPSNTSERVSSQLG